MTHTYTMNATTVECLGGEDAARLFVLEAMREIKRAGYSRAERNGVLRRMIEWEVERLAGLRSR